jgi:hypothetical protein
MWRSSRLCHPQYKYFARARAWRREFLHGKIVLEIGAGQDFGFPLILIGLGSRGVLVDKYLVIGTRISIPLFIVRYARLPSKNFPESILLG